MFQVRLAVDGPCGINTYVRKIIINLTSGNFSQFPKNKLSISRILPTHRLLLPLTNKIVA